MKPINKNIINRDGWDERVLNLFRHLCGKEAKPDHPFLQLALMKRAIKEVSAHMQREEPEKKIKEDELSVAMKALRAIEHGRIHSFLRLIGEIPEGNQAELENLRGKEHNQILEELHRPGGKGLILHSIRETVKQAAKKEIIEDIGELRNMQEERGHDDDKVSRFKGSIAKKLSKLKPGRGRP